MRVFIVLLGIFFPLLSMAGRVCKNNDFKECSEVLQKAHKADPGKPFREVYEDICATNSKFKCTKVTVMGNPDQTMKELAVDHPKAHLFIVQHDDGKYIYLFEKKAK